MEDHFLDIEAYLDGSMSEAERNDFEIQLARDAALRTSLEEIRQLRSDLAWHYASNDVAAAGKMRREYQRRRWIWLTCLLALLVVTLAGFFIWRNAGPASTHQQNDIPPMQDPPASDPGPPVNDHIPVNDGSQQVSPPALKSAPMAGNIKKDGASTGELYRDLPKEEVSAQYQQFFEQQMKAFLPAVEQKGIWAPAVAALTKGQPAPAFSILKKMPVALAGNDTTLYLQAVAALQLKRPAAAETLLYPLITDKKWQTEGQYLLVWVYLLRGEEDLARAALKLLPGDYRDRKVIATFLDR